MKEKAAMSESLQSTEVTDGKVEMFEEELHNSAATVNHHKETEDESVLVIPRSRKDTAYSEDLSNYYIPRSELLQDKRVELYCGYLFLSIEQMKEIMQSFQNELQLGLEAHMRHPHIWKEEESCFKMIDSYVDVLPTGQETGVCYAIDFGGTNLRALRAVLEGNGKIEKTQVKYSLKYQGPSAQDRGLLDGKSTATKLFDHFSNRIRRIMDISGDLESDSVKENPVPLGFTFSFPCMQTSIKNSLLIKWTKGFETGRETDDPVEGKDVGILLNEAFNRLNVPAQLVAILNDTVGTLLSCCYQKKSNTPDCLIGMILGTGINACYVEPNAAEYNYVGKVINIELGNFNRKLFMTEVDHEINWNLSNRDCQLFEKQVSGSYLGEIVRRYFIKVFQYRAPSKSWIEETITSEDVAVILNDNTSDLRVCRQIILDKWGVSMDLADLKDIKSICVAVFDRSSRLAAIAICAIALHIKRLEADDGALSCAVDGSLYIKNPWYAERVRLHMKSLIGDKADRIVIIPADDGSGKGAAILATIVNMRNKSIKN